MQPLNVRTVLLDSSSAHAINRMDMFNHELMLNTRICNAAPTCASLVFPFPATNVLPMPNGTGSKGVCDWRLCLVVPSLPGGGPTSLLYCFGGGAWEGVQWTLSIRPSSFKLYIARVPSHFAFEPIADPISAEIPRVQPPRISVCRSVEELCQNWGAL